MEQNSFDNDFRKGQSAKILSIYGIQINNKPSNDIMKADSEDTERIQKLMTDVVPDMIEKGMISSELSNGYGSSEPLKFTKTGKEFKEKLPSVISQLQGEKQNIETQMIAIKQQIGVEPDKTFKSYNVKGITINRYPWKMCDAPYDEVLKKYLDETDQNKLCQQYNSLADFWISISEDISCAEIIMANVEDSKKYTLSINQLVALNFK